MELYGVSLALKLIDTLVMPIMEYGIEFWVHKDLDKIERINQHLFLQVYFGNKTINC